MTNMRSEVWAVGDRVRWYSRDSADGSWYFGRVGEPKGDPRAFEQHWVWVNWEDGSSGFCDPNCLEPRD